jgi:hypothetical protein
VWRLQVRTDPFSSGSAGVRVVPVLSAEAAPDRAVEALVRRSQRMDLGDSLATHVRREGLLPGESPHRQAAFLAALQELAVAHLPASLSGHVQDTVGARATIETWRLLAAAGVVLVGLFVGAYLLWRGWRASVEAGRLLGEDAGAPPSTARRRAMVGVMGLAVAIAVIFALIAVFIATRGTF